MFSPAIAVRAVEQAYRLVDSVDIGCREFVRLKDELEEIRYPRYDWIDTFKGIVSTPETEDSRDSPSWHSLERGEGVPERVAIVASRARALCVSQFLEGERWKDAYVSPLQGVIDRVRSSSVWSFRSPGGIAILVGGAAVVVMSATLINPLVTVLIVMGAIATLLLVRKSLSSVRERRSAFAASLAVVLNHLRNTIENYGSGILPRSNFLTDLDFVQSELASCIGEEGHTWYGRALSKALDGMSHEVPAIADALFRSELMLLRKAAAADLSAASQEASRIRAHREAHKKQIAQVLTSVRDASRMLPGATAEVAEQCDRVSALLESARISRQSRRDGVIGAGGEMAAALFAAQEVMGDCQSACHSMMVDSLSCAHAVAERTLNDQIGELVFTPELAAAMARRIADAGEALASIEEGVQSLAHDRDWSLAVAAPDGPAMAQVVRHAANPSVFEGRRILRYVHRDLIRLGSTADQGPHGHGALPFVLTLRAPSNGSRMDPRVAPPIHERSIVVSARDRQQADLADAFVRQLAFRSLGLRQPGDLHIAVIDPIRAGGSMREVGQLMGIAFEPSDLAVDAPSIDALLKGMRQEMTRKILHSLGSEAHTIDSRLSEASSGPIHFRTLCVFGYPRGFDESSIAELEQLCRTGDQVGVHVFVSMYGSEMAAFEAANPRVQTNVIVRSAAWVRIVDVESRALRLKLDPGSDHDGETGMGFTMDRPWSAGEVDGMIRAVRHDHQVRDTGRLSPIEAARRLRDRGGGVLPDAAREASLVLGTESGNASLPVDIPFGRDIAHHALLVGATGSGKTRLLQAIVAGACINYAPQELEFWLLDFKSGTGFKPFAEAQVPHCKVIGLSSDVTYGLDALQKLVDEMGRRQVLFKRSSVENLEQYSSLQRRSDGALEPLPRVVAIIDEFQLLFSRDTASAARVRMAQIVQKGRSAGMHLFLATQAIEGQAADIDAFRSQIKVNVILQSSSSTQRGVIDSEDRREYRKLRRFEGLLDVNGSQTVFDVIDMPDRPGEPNPNLRHALDLVRQTWPDECRAMVYDGEAQVIMPTLDRMRLLAREVLVEEREPGIPIVLGTAAAVSRAPAHAFLHTAMNGNIVICATDERVAELQMIALVLSLCASSDVNAVEVDVLQAERLGRTWRQAAQLLPPEVAVRYYDTTASSDAIAAISGSLEQGSTGARRLVLCREWTVLKPFADSGGFSDEAALVTRILAEGPVAGVHAVAVTTTGRKLPLDARDKYGIRIASAGASELMSSIGFNPTAFGRLFVETPSRPDMCVEYIPFSYGGDSNV